jgi:hypothetical protein
VNTDQTVVTIFPTHTQDGTHKDSKLAKPNDHWLNPTTTSNRSPLFNKQKISTTTHHLVRRPRQPLAIYITSVTNIPPLLQLLDQNTPQLYEIKALPQNEVKVRPRNPQSYSIITKALLDRNTQFHIFKLEEERTYRAVLKYMHYYIAPENIKTEIENLGHKVANVWNAKHYRTKQPLSMFLIDLLPAPNNKDIFNVEFLQQCKIRFEPPRHSRDIKQCANCQIYGHTKNFCHLKLRCVKCAGDHSTSQYPRKERSSDVRLSSAMEITLPTTRAVRSIETSKKTYQPLLQKQCNPPAPLQKTVHAQPGVTYAQITKQHISNPAPQDTAPLTNQSQQLPSDTHDLKLLLKTLFEQLGTMLNLLSTVLSKLP